MKPNSSRIRKWRKWFARIDNQIALLRSYIELRRRLYILIGQSPVSQTDSLLWQYLHFGLTNEIIIRVGRLCEPQSRRKHRRVYSLHALLEEFKDFNLYLARRRYVGRIKPPKPAKGVRPGSSRDKEGIVFRMRTDTYNKWVGANVDVMSKAAIEQDIDVLERAHEKIKTYRDKFVAHNDLYQKNRRPLEYKEIPNVSDVIRDIAEKYNLLVFRQSYPYDELNRYFNLTELFSKAWMPSETDAEKLKVLFESKQ